MNKKNEFHPMRRRPIGSSTSKQATKTYKIGDRVLSPSKMGNSGDWTAITTFLLRECEDVKKHLCVGCSMHTLYDKNNKSYKVSRSMTLEEVKIVVEEIRKINSTI